MTYQGSPTRRGFNPSESTITQTTLTSTSSPKFNKQRSVAINGAAYGQPLVLPNVVANGTTYNDVVYVATEQDNLYAIDAATGNNVWGPISLLQSNYTYLSAQNDLNNCTNIQPAPGDVGVTGTPVIDISQNVPGVNNTITQGALYVVAKMRTPATGTATNYAQWLYAIDVTSGSIKASIQISGSFNNISFDSGYSQRQNQRGALLAVPVANQNPQVVITWGAHCDHQNFPYNGWVMSYQLNHAQNQLTQTGIWASVPSDTNYEGGIWEGGSGPAADASGHFYFAIGNGSVNLNASTPPNETISCSTTPCDFGNSVVKMQASGGSLSVLDFFTPFDWSTRSTNDYDLGSGGVTLLPMQSGGNPANLLMQAGKEGSIYVLQTDTGYLGGYNSGNTDQVVEYIGSVLCYQTSPPVECGVWGAPAWWTTTYAGGSSTGLAYFSGKNLGIMQFAFYPNGNSCTNPTTSAGLCTSPNAQTIHTFGWPAPTPVVTAPTASSTAAIVWAIDNNNAGSGGKPNLWAFKATDLTCLFTTDSNARCSGGRVSSTDQPAGDPIKFTVPTVANGRVYVGTTGGTSQGYVNIYGVN